MDKLPPFEVTRWVDKYEHSAKYDLGGSCSPALSIVDIINISENSPESETALSMRSLKLSYGSMLGSETLRENVAALYPKIHVTKDDILTTNGAIGANNIVLSSLLSAGDHVICVYPTYEQLYQTPRAMGAEVTLWKLDVETGRQLDLNFLKSSIRKNTKMIILNSPNNPTGTCISARMQGKIVEIAREHALILMADEVFRPLFHLEPSNPEQMPVSFLELGYDKTVVTGSMSKAYGLAGTRVGWIATKSPDIISACVRIRDYTNISVSQIDELIAAEALNERCRIPILARNNAIAVKNLAILGKFVQRNIKLCQWSKPTASTTTLLRFCTAYGEVVDDVEFCLKLQERTGVMIVPASLCFGDGDHSDFKGYCRVQFLVETEVLQGALTELEVFLGSYLSKDVSLAT
jgi:aspartate/methionine/tyrosine aminotransferase